MCKRCTETTILRGVGMITRDGGNVVFAAWHPGDGWLGRWGQRENARTPRSVRRTNPTGSGNSSGGATGMTCPVIRESGGAGQVALMSMENEGGGARLFRRFAVFDATTLENRQELVLPGGPAEFCCVPPDTLVTPVWRPRPRRRRTARRLGRSRKSAP